MRIVDKRKLSTDKKCRKGRVLYNATTSTPNFHYIFIEDSYYFAISYSHSFDKRVINTWDLGDLSKNWKSYSGY